MELFSALSLLDMPSMNMLREQSAKRLRQRLLLLSMDESSSAHLARTCSSNSLPGVANCCNCPPRTERLNLEK